MISKERVKEHTSIYVTLFGKTGLNENSVVMHFKCVDNALQCVDNGF